ncbi:SDR family oxidoreductase [Pectinatus cerevisiiphilus]|uniref:2-deoxy-D-gluconate 3-dehydrogenase n=1 Tax=Pectinatus cerevisiiphilus TaxID=86956 RepID=A0A4R3KBV7_9FIRM|nr:SDR family oxidoreductase [Pectinatus cerevisiiphilus]TCS80121.1 2-deoxy-D-gluconate 3-dehydrogenase [Pectinatus cerevisiiphilus]
MLDIFNLNGKKAIVTGGGRGLGKGMAEGLCEAGAEVVLIGSSDSAVKTADEFNQKKYKAFAVKGNLAEQEQIPVIFEKALALLDGKVDILINNAGLQSRHKCEEFPLADWNRVLQVNLNTVFTLCQLAGRKMLEEGYGKIINMASMLSFFGGFTVPAYAASKGGVAQLTKALSNEWAKRNVHVNAIAPGYMDTEMNVNLVNDSKRNKEILERIPAGRWGTPADMKGLAVFLASPASDYINGAVIPIDGGYLGK